MAISTTSEKGGFMKCEEAAEFVSALCDGELVPRDMAGHIGECGSCRSRLNAYLGIGAELRRLASLEQPLTMRVSAWNRDQKPGFWLNWWKIRSKTMRIPKLAFGAMIGLIFLLSGGLVLVRARTGLGGG